MADKAHVGFINAHAERNGRHHNEAFFIEKTFLMKCAQITIKAGMVGQRWKAFAAEKLGGGLNTFTR